MRATCDECGRTLQLERVRVLVHSGGDYRILGRCCSFRYAAHKQYEPENPREAVSRIQGGVVDGGVRL